MEKGSKLAKALANSFLSAENREFLVHLDDIPEDKMVDFTIDLLRQKTTPEEVSSDLIKKTMNAQRIALLRSAEGAGVKKQLEDVTVGISIKKGKKYMRLYTCSVSLRLAGKKYSAKAELKWA